MLSPKTFRVSLTPTLPEQPPVYPETFQGEKIPAETWWEQVLAEFAIEAGGTFERWLNDTSLVSYDASTNSFVVAVPDRFRIDWLRNRLARGVARKLSS